MSLREVVPYFSGSLVPNKFKLGPLISSTFLTMMAMWKLCFCRRGGIS